MVRDFFFFNDTATTEIYTLSLHDALPIFDLLRVERRDAVVTFRPNSRNLPADAKRNCQPIRRLPRVLDRKSTRLNSSHANISYAVFCLKKKKSEATTLVRRLFPSAVGLVE